MLGQKKIRLIFAQPNFFIALTKFWIIRHAKLLLFQKSFGLTKILLEEKNSLISR